MNSTSKFIKTSFIYMVGQILVKIISFLLLPIFTSMLSPSDYGYFDVTVATMNVITPIIFLEIPTAFLRFVYDYSLEEDKNKVVTNTFFITFISLLLYLNTFIVLGFVKDIKYLPIICFYGISIAINNIYQFLSRGFHHNKTYMLSGVINGLIYASSNILFIVIFKLGIVSLFMSAIIANFIQVFIIELKIRGIKRFNKIYIDYKLIKSMLKFSSPLVVNSISVWCATSLSRIIIASKLGVSTNGYIAIADKFLVAVSMFSSIVALSWQETAFAMKSSDDNNTGKYSLALNMYIKALGCGVLMLIPLTYILFPYVVNEKFVQAKEIIPIYYLVAVLSALSTFFTSIFTAEKKTKTIFYSTILSAVANLSVLYITIPKVGVFAFVFAALAGSTVTLVIRYVIVSLKIAKISLDYKSIAILIIFYILVVYIFFKSNKAANLAMLLISIIVSMYVLRDIINRIISSIKEPLHKKLKWRTYSK